VRLDEKDMSWYVLKNSAWCIIKRQANGQKNDLET
jgi:hypothetical protein